MYALNYFVSIIDAIQYSFLQETLYKFVSVLIVLCADTVFVTMYQNKTIEIIVKVLF